MRANCMRSALRSPLSPSECQLSRGIEFGSGPGGIIGRRRGSQPPGPNEYARPVRCRGGDSTWERPGAGGAPSLAFSEGPATVESGEARFAAPSPLVSSRGEEPAVQDCRGGVGLRALSEPAGSRRGAGMAPSSGPPEPAPRVLNRMWWSCRRARAGTSMRCIVSCEPLHEQNTHRRGGSGAPPPAAAQPASLGLPASSGASHGRLVRRGSAAGLL